MSTDRKPIEHGPIAAAAVAAARAAIRAAREQHKAADPPPRPEPETSGEGTARVEPVRTAIAAKREQETTR